MSCYIIYLRCCLYTYSQYSSLLIYIHHTFLTLRRQRITDTYKNNPYSNHSIQYSIPILPPLVYWLVFYYLLHHRMTYASIIWIIVLSLMEFICFMCLISVIGYVRRDRWLNDWAALVACICLMLLLSIPIVSLIQSVL